MADTTALREKFAALPWQELTHAYGDASDIPEAILALTSSSRKERNRALTFLRRSVYHQGLGGYTAMPYVPAFLIELLRDPSVEDKGPILEFLALLSEEHRWYTRGLHESYLLLPDWLEKFFTPEVKEVNARTYEAVCEGIPVYIDLLSHPEESTRLGSSYLLAWLEEAAQEAFPRLKEQLLLEEKPLLMAGHTLGMGLMLRHLSGAGALSAEALQEERDSLRRHLYSSNTLLRASSAIALAVSGAAADASFLEALEEAILRQPHQKGFPWSHGDLAHFALSALGDLHRTQNAEIDSILADLLNALGERTMGLRSLEEHEGIGEERFLATALFWTFPRERKERPWPLGYLPAERRVIRLLEKYPEMAAFHRRGILRDYQLETLPPLKEKRPFVYLSPLDEPLNLTPGGKSRTLPIRQWWRILCQKMPSDRTRAILDEMAQLLTAYEVYTLFEHLLADNDDTLRGERSRALMLLLAAMIQGTNAAPFALREKVRVLLSRGCLSRYTGERHTYQLFARLLVQIAPRYGEAERPKLEKEIIALLERASEVFEHRDLEELRAAVSFLSPLHRRLLIDRFKVRSFAEPDEAWALYDLCPCQRHTRRLLRLMPSYQEFFAGAGAFRAMQVLAAQGDEAIPDIKRALSVKNRPYRRVLAAALHRMSTSPAREALLAFRADKDPDVRAIACARRQLSLARYQKLGIDPESIDVGGRAKGGVIGADGKPWRGERTVFRAKRS